MPLTVKVLTLTTTCKSTFSLYYRILIQGGKTHHLIFIVGTNNFTEYLQSYQILIFIYYKFLFYYFSYNTVYSVCFRYISCNLEQKQGSNCLLSIRRKWFLFIHIVLDNIVDFWNSDFLKSQLDLPSAWIFSFTFFCAWIFFLGIFPWMIFFCFFPHPPPITFLMVCPLLSLFEEPASSLEVVSSKNLRKYDHSTEMLSSDISEWVIFLVASNVF